MCTCECTYFFYAQKIEQAANPTLSTMYSYFLVLTVFSSSICFCCSSRCCNIMLFSFSAMYLLTKCRIKSLLVNSSPPFRLLEKASLSFNVRLLIYYYNFISKTSEQNKKISNFFQFFIIEVLIKNKIF